MVYKQTIDYLYRSRSEANPSGTISRSAETLISPTGGFYRLQPPSDTRFVVKISDAPWAGERARTKQ